MSFRVSPKKNEISMEEYIKRSKHSRKAEEITTPLMKAILDLIRYHNHVWRRGGKPETDDWRAIGVELYEKTGKIVSAHRIKRAFLKVKKELKDRIEQYIVHEKLGYVLVRALLNHWELYKHLDFLRGDLGHFEEGLRKGKILLEFDDDFELNLDSDEEEEKMEVDEPPEEEEAKTSSGRRRAARRRKKEAEAEERRKLYEQIEHNQLHIDRFMATYKCPRCYVPYGEHEKTPLVLACGHSFCEKCCKELQKIAYLSYKKWNLVRCNSCGSNTQMKSDNVKELPVNWGCKKTESFFEQYSKPKRIL